MDKKFIRSLPRPEADPAYAEIARDRKESRWILKAEETGGMLQLVVWDAAKLKTGNMSAVYRMFFTDDDYITQDLSAGSTKWLTGKLFSVLKICWWSQLKQSMELQFCDDRSRNLLEKRFLKQNDTSSVWNRLDYWQDDIIEKRRQKRYEKELQHTEEMMRVIPDMPEDFGEWVREYALRDYRYLLYDGEKRRMRDGFCTHCGQRLLLDSKKMTLKMNTWSECPNCNSTVMLKTIKRFRKFEQGSRHAVIIQRTPSGKLLARCFGISVSFRKTMFPLQVSTEWKVWEDGRVFLGDKWDSFEYAEYKQSRKIRWCPDTGKNYFEQAVLYTKGLRKLLAGSIYQYSGIEAFQEKEGPGQPIPVFKFLSAYPKEPRLEMLVKTGLTNYARDVITDILWYHKKDAINDLKKLSRDELRILRDLNGGHRTLGLILELKLCRAESELKAETLRFFCEVFGANARLAHELLMMQIPLRKFTAYARKQILGKADRKNFVSDWKDYIGWCEQLGYDMADGYVTMPPDFIKAHQRLYKEYTAYTTEQARIRQEEIANEVRRIMSELVTKTDGIEMRSRKFMIVIPKSADDLKEEGRALHHCVGTYAERVAKGQTMILFVRKVEEPDIPFFTMEWKDHHIVQCRGSHNCAMPKDVEAFVKAFEKRMQKDLFKEKIRVRAC